MLFVCVRAYIRVTYSFAYFSFHSFLLQDFVILTNFKQIAQLPTKGFFSCSRSLAHSFTLSVIFLLSFSRLFIIYTVMFSPNINKSLGWVLLSYSIVACQKCNVESLECVDFFMFRNVAMSTSMHCCHAC